MIEANLEANKKIIDDELAVRKEIISNNSLNMFVEAGAGAGKTSLVVDKIINQLKNGADPERIVVITFTNKAADELHDRIVDEFVELSEQRDDVNIDQMTISTIHSFCNKMLSERAFDAKRKLDERLIENAEEEQMKNSFFNSWYAGLEYDKVEAISSFFKDSKLAKKTIYTAFNELSKLSDDVEVVYRRDLSGKAFEDIIDKRKEFFEQFKKFLLDTVNSFYIENAENFKGFADFEESFNCKEIKTREKGDRKHAVYKEDMCKLLENTNKYSALRDMCKLADVKKCENYFGGKKTGVYVTNLFEPVVAWVNKNIPPFFCEMQRYIHAEVVRLALEAREKFTDSEQAITNDMLLRKAKELICENKAAWEYFVQKYDHIYVDEFQDTDNIQTELIWKLACKSFEGDELRDGALFIVGDPKQSIYRFRSADVTQYFATQAKMAKLDNAMIYKLNINFRSSSVVVDWINKKFSTPNAFGEMYNDMIATKTEYLEDSKCLQGVYSLPVTYDKADEPKALCDVILKLTNPDNNFVIIDYDKDNNPYERAVTYSDILVLTDVAKNTMPYVEALSNNGIMVNYTGEIKLNTVEELKKFYILFTYITSPKDKKAKYGALNALSGDNKSAVRDMKNASRRLKKLFIETKGMDAYGKALYIAKHLDVLFEWDEEIDVNYVISVQTKLKQMLETVFAMPVTDNRTLAKRFNSYINAGLKSEMLLKDDTNAVRFMNVHQAKGLEGNIVIMAKRSSDAYRTDSSYLDNTVQPRKYYPLVKIYSAVKYDSSDNIFAEMSNEVEKKHENACYMDAINLQYVAATRAKRALIVLGNLGDKRPYFEDFDLDKCKQPIDLLDESKIVKNTPESCEYVYSCDIDISEEQKGSPFICIKPSDFEKSGTTGKRETSLQADTEDNDWDEEADFDRTEPSDEVVSVEGDDRPKGNIVGNVLHRSYELFVNRWRRDFSAETAPIIKSCVNQAIIENAEDIPAEQVEAYKKFVVQTLNCFTEDNEMSALVKGAKEIYTELEFSYMLDQAEAKKLLAEIVAEGKFDTYNGVWVNGTADLVLVAQDGSIVIADYKSDKNTDKLKDFKARLNEKYKNQLTLYKYAMAKLLDTDLTKISTRIVNYEKQ